MRPQPEKAGAARPVLRLRRWPLLLRISAIVCWACSIAQALFVILGGGDAFDRILGTPRWLESVAAILGVEWYYVPVAAFGLAGLALFFASFAVETRRLLKDRTTDTTADRRDSARKES